LLLIGDPPQMGPYGLPGNNYHVYDVPLFWTNVRQDCLRRVAAWVESLITEQAAEFRAALPEGGRVARARRRHQDRGHGVLRQWLALRVGGQDACARQVRARPRRRSKALVVERAAQGVVIGLPLNMDGSSGPRAQASRAYARNLAPLGLPVLLWDERWSTASAERAMIDQDLSRPSAPSASTAMPAAVILQAAIDRLAGGVF
jgi:putative Holliday junction resolvase